MKLYFKNMAFAQFHESVHFSQKTTISRKMSQPWNHELAGPCALPHARLTALFPGLPRWAGTRKVKPIWILLKQETVSGSGISWAICKFAPRSRQITMPAPHHSVFYRPDALPAAQPTASKHWRQMCNRKKTSQHHTTAVGLKLWEVFGKTTLLVLLGNLLAFSEEIKSKMLGYTVQESNQVNAVYYFIIP